MNTRYELYIRSLSTSNLLPIIQNSQYVELTNFIQQFNITGNDLLNLKEYDVLIKYGSYINRKLFQQLLNNVQTTPEVLFPLKPTLRSKPSFLAKKLSMHVTPKEIVKDVTSELNGRFSQSIQLKKAVSLDSYEENANILQKPPLLQHNQHCNPELKLLHQEKDVKNGKIHRQASMRNPPTKPKPSSFSFKIRSRKLSLEQKFESDQELAHPNEVLIDESKQLIVRNDTSDKETEIPKQEVSHNAEIDGFLKEIEELTQGLFTADECDRTTASESIYNDILNDYDDTYKKPEETQGSTLSESNLKNSKSAVELKDISENNVNNDEDHYHKDVTSCLQRESQNSACSDVEPPPLPERPSNIKFTTLKKNDKEKPLCDEPDVMNIYDRLPDICLGNGYYDYLNPQISPEETFRKNLFFRDVTREEGEKILCLKEVGAFLFRPSSNFFGVIMINGKMSVKNIPIRHDDKTGKYYLATAPGNSIEDAVCFNNLQQLIYYYVKNVLNGEKLLKPELNILD